MRLAWKKNGEGWFARSAEGSTARVYPLDGRSHVFAMQADLGDQTFWKGADASQVISKSKNTPTATQKVLNHLKHELEGYLLRYDTTGIQDPKAAHDTIKAMEPVEWARRLSDWSAKNPANDTVGAPGVATIATTTPTEDRFIHRGFMPDANRINARRGLPHMSRLERWAADGVIEMIISETAATEAARGGALQARKARSYVQSQTLATTERERAMLRQIERAIFPKGAKTTRDTNDVEITFNAHKYKRILVTADGLSKPRGILAAKEKLAALGITVMSDEEACAHVEGLVAARDERARREAAKTGARLPPWVGRD